MPSLRGAPPFKTSYAGPAGIVCPICTDLIAPATDESLIGPQVSTWNDVLYHVLVGHLFVRNVADWRTLKVPWSSAPIQRAAVFVECPCGVLCWCEHGGQSSLASVMALEKHVTGNVKLWSNDSLIPQTIVDHVAEHMAVKALSDELRIEQGECEGSGARNPFLPLGETKVSSQ